MKLLIVAPHPDDELIGCGGTIIKNIEKKNKVEVLFMTSGDLSEHKLRETEVKEIYEPLKIKYYLLREKDRFIQYNEEVLGKIIKLLRQIKPDILYFPHGEESDRDHKETYKILNEASWLACDNFMPHLGKPCNIKKILLYEVWTPIKEPQFYENISRVINQKISLLQKYKSQINFQRYDLAIQGLNQYRGIMIAGCEFAEAFKIIRIDKL